MSRWTMYRIHKWIAVTVGVFFLVWLISGIAMILPNRLYGPVPSRIPAPVDLRHLIVSPAEAVANLAKVLASDYEVNSVSLKRIQGRVAYHISVKHGSSHLVDARTGEIFTISPKIAEQFAQEEFPVRAGVLQVNLVTHHNFTYPWGPLPAYAVVFDDSQATISYVSPADGTIRRTTRLSRIQTVIARLHTFEPLKLLTKREGVRKGLLLLLSVIGIGAAGTGYYLSLPRRRVSRQKLAGDTVLPQEVSGQVPPRVEASDRAVATWFQRRE